MCYTIGKPSLAYAPINDLDQHGYLPNLIVQSVRYNRHKSLRFIGNTVRVVQFSQNWFSVFCLDWFE